MTNLSAKETEDSGDYANLTCLYGYDADVGVWRKVTVDANGKIKIDPEITDAIWDETLEDHTTAGSAGKKLADIPTTAMRGTDNALLAANYAERGTDNAYLATDGASLPSKADIGDLPWDEATSNHVNSGSFGKKISDINTQTTNLYHYNDDIRHSTYPLKANGVTVSPNATTWSWGAWTEVIPTNQISRIFYITSVISSCGCTQERSIQLGKGTAGNEYGFSEVDIIERGYEQSATRINPAVRVTQNTRISVRVAANNATDIICKLSYFYIK